jgi:hypothetical protein
MCDMVPLLFDDRTHEHKHVIAFPHTHMASALSLSVPHARTLPMSGPLASPAFIRKIVHVSNPHFCHVGCLRWRDRLEAIAISREAECAMDGVAADDKAEGGKYNDEDDYEEGQGVAGIVAGDKSGHDDWRSMKSM